MKVALAYKPRRLWPKFDWVARAFACCGHDVRRVGTLDALRYADSECDFVLFEQRGGGLEQNAVAEMAASRRAVWAEWLFDLVAVDPCKPIVEQPSMSFGLGNPSPWMKCLRAMDVAFVKERGLLAEYEEAGVDAVWLDQACPSDMPKCDYSDATPEWDVLVVGSRSAGWLERRRLASALVSEGFVVAWAGHPGGDNLAGVLALPFCLPHDLPRLCEHAACVLNVDLRSDLDGYASDRLYLLAGVGACQVRRFSLGDPIDCPALSFRTEAELLELVVTLRRDVDLRRRCGEASRRWAMASHTYEHRVAQIESVVRRCEDRRRACAGSAAARAV